MAYIGNEPGVGSFIIATERFNGTGACTQFTISQTGISDANAIEVIVSSVQQDPINSYSIASGVITFTEAPPSGTQNIIVTYRATTVITYSNVTASQLADGSITATKLASGVLPTATANSAASYANSAFAVANTSSNTSVASGSYANSAFLVANTPTHVANSAASYANSAFLAANTTSNNATSASLYANSGFAVANSAASYANSAFLKANTTVTAANGGTGLTTLTANNVVLGNGTSSVQFVAPGTVGNVLVSNGTTWTSGGAGVTSLNSQTGAITNTTFDSIGSCAILVSAQTSDTAVGGTIAGSSLRYSITTGIQGAGPGGSGLGYFGYINGSSNSYGGGGTAVSGTWRKMYGMPNWTSVAVCGGTNYYFYSALWVRIS